MQLFVNGPSARARELAENLPSIRSRDHGRPFAEVFRFYEGDFYKVDPMLFSPAVAIVTALESGETFRQGPGALLGPVEIGVQCLASAGQQRLEVLAAPGAFEFVNRHALPFTSCVPRCRRTRRPLLPCGAPWRIR